jgi:hypothetical protein
MKQKKYSDYIKELGFLPSEIDDLKEHTEENGGSLSVNLNDGKKELKLFFTKGQDRKIIVSKNGNKFVTEIRGDKKSFGSFKALLEFLNEET